MARRSRRVGVVKTIRCAVSLARARGVPLTTINAAAATATTRQGGGTGSKAVPSSSNPPPSELDISCKEARAMSNNEGGVRRDCTNKVTLCREAGARNTSEEQEPKQREIF